MSPLSCSRSFRFFLVVVWLSFADATLAQDQRQAADPGQATINSYPYNQTWGGPKTTAKPSPQTPADKPAPVISPPPSAPPAAATAPADASQAGVPDSTADALPALPALPASTRNNHEVSAAGDFFYGTGTVTVPVGYSLAKSLGGLATVTPTPKSAPRNSEYIGGTISYSYLHSWFVDVSYDHGNSSGSAPISSSFLGVNPSFKINDNWYQAYLRYTFPGLRAKRFSAYLRAGASYVQADLTLNSASLYHQTDHTKDYLGNAGFGLLYASRRFNVGLQMEGEGFYGTRSQESNEQLESDAGLKPVTVHIDNTLYGGIGRGTVHFEYRPGHSGRFKIFADGGAQAKYTLISYPNQGTSHELLWGPYVKLGLSYSF
jgi:hypothetical protein